MANKSSPNSNRIFWIVSVLFLLSGATGLIYQVLWMRELSLFFGNDTYSSSITLSAFFGGLALGGWLISQVADRLKNHLAWYGGLELAIGGYALLIHPLLQSFYPLLSRSYLLLYDVNPLPYNVLRALIAFVVLLIPTTMMGATFPLIVRALTLREDTLGEVSGHFYAANTFGAVTGTFVAGLVLIPQIGVQSTLIFGVALNTVVGLGAFAIARQLRIAPGVASEREKSSQNREKPPLVSSVKIQPPHSRAALVGIGLSGLGALAFEVVWTRILVQSFSGTVYSFSIMLISVLIGIAVGSRVISRVLDKTESPLLLLGRLEFGVAFSIAVLAALSSLAPRLFGILVWGISSLNSTLFGVASITATLVISVLFLLIPTALLGAAFPTALKAYSQDLESLGRDTGRITSVNTLGGIIGSLLAGFILIPLIGARFSLIVLSLFYLANSVYILAQASYGYGAALKDVGAATVVMALPLFFVGFGPQRTVLNYNLQTDDRPEVLFHDEGLTGYVEVVRTPKGDKVLSLNGNIEADTTLVQRRHFILKGHLPLMAVEKPKDILVVGLGMGITTNALARHPGVENVDVIEISPDILDAQGVLLEENGDILRNPRVKITLDDGRNYLSFTEKTYDLITADPIHPRISGVGFLYTVEYYELIKRKLAEDGVVLQWMPMYSISPESFAVAVRSFDEVFPEASLWYVPGHALLMARKNGEATIDYGIFMDRIKDPEVLSDLSSVGFGEPIDFLSLRLLSPAALDAYLENSHQKMLNSDDNAYLEYHTPHEYLWTPDAILQELMPFVEFNSEFIDHAPEGFKAELEKAYSYRNKILIDELYQEGILQ